MAIEPGLQPGFDHAAVELFPVGHAQHPSGVQATQEAAQLLRRGLAVGGFAEFVLQNGGVGFQVVVYPVAEFRQDSIADEVEGTALLRGIHGRLSFSWFEAGASVGDGGDAGEGGNFYSGY